jgi:catechol 2,3-dioxygenase-like lactoylglutathione lyase family enzyme
MTVPRPYRLGRAAPGVPVRDVDTALAFYVGVLGMTETFRNGDPVGFVIVERDDAEIHLTLQPSHRATTANVLHLMVDDAAAFHAHVQQHGVRIVKGIRDADYGMRTFVMADPDGNRIDVGEDL